MGDSFIINFVLIVGACIMLLEFLEVEYNNWIVALIVCFSFMLALAQMNYDARLQIAKLKAGCPPIVEKGINR